MPANSKSRQEPEREPELDISSLIDVSFLLLIFFIVSSTLLKIEGDLKMTLPEPTPGDPNPALEIAIADDGRVTVGGQELAGPSEHGAPGGVDQLLDELVEFKKRADLLGDPALVSLSADDGCNTQRFVDVINALATANIQNVAMHDSFAAAN